MKIFTNNTFNGYWAVPTAAVVCALNKESAVEILNTELKNIGLKPTVKVEDMKELNTKSSGVLILSDGSY